jgi:hypothetical protein
LNIRLKELCAEGILTKEEGMYKSNGASGFGNNGGHLMKGLSRVFDDKRMRTGLMLIALLTAFSVSGYVLAMIVPSFMYVEPQAEPKPIGSFTMALVVSNVNDLYAWQAAITFNSTQISVANTQAGDMMKGQFPLFSNSTDTSKGLLLLTETLEGNVSGKAGSGTLATITFEYYMNTYQLPSLSDQNAVFSTWLEDSTLTTIPKGQTLLTLNVIG